MTKNLTPLAAWRHKQELTLERLTELVNGQLPRGKSVSLSLVHRYENRLISRPTPEIVDAIQAVTAGKVTYLDLCPPIGPARKRVRKCA